MNRIVIYESSTGFTEQYAKWIAEELDCPCEPLKKITKDELSGFDQVIFGGWIMGNGIMGLEKIRGMVTPNFLFAVGATPAFDEVIDAIKAQNKINATPFFYMTGGFRFERLGFAKKMILKTLGKSTRKKENRNRQEEFMANTLGTSIDSSGREQIIPLVQYIVNL